MQVRAYDSGLYASFSPVSALSRAVCVAEISTLPREITKWLARKVEQKVAMQKQMELLCFCFPSAVTDASIPSVMCIYSHRLTLLIHCASSLLTVACHNKRFCECIA